MIIVTESFSPLQLAIRAASRSAIQAIVSLAQRTEVCKGRILLDDKSTDLAYLGATLEHKRRLDAIPNARTQLIQLLAQSLAAETATARKHQPSN